MDESCMQNLEFMNGLTIQDRDMATIWTNVVTTTDKVALILQLLNDKLERIVEKLGNFENNVRNYINYRGKNRRTFYSPYYNRSNRYNQYRNIRYKNYNNTKSD